MPLNVEIKAKTKRANEIRKVLKEKGARFVGIDHQIDTYFVCNQGRLKLREGNIENNLIFYQRSDQEGPKTSKIILHAVQESTSLKAALGAAYGIWKVVDKKREIYFIDNVKFHIDQVKELGAFVEIEAIDTDGKFMEDDLLAQCQHFMEVLGIRESDLLASSYSDMVSTSTTP